MRKYKYSFTGFYGMKNFGDDLFSFISAYGADKYWGETKAAIIGPDVGCKDVKYAVPKSIQNLYYQNNILGQSLRLLTSYSYARDSDVLVYSGGSLFSNSSSKVRKVVDNYSKARLYAIGVSIGPFSNLTDEASVKNSLMNFEYISVRDKKSFEIVSGFDLPGRIIQSSDLAGLIPDIFNSVKNEKKKEKKIVGFSPCNLLKKNADMHSFCNSFYESVVRLKKQFDLEINLMILNDNPIIGDRALIELLHKRLLSIGVKCRVFAHTDIGIHAMLDLINNLDLMVTARLHGAISAYTLGIPYVLYEYHDKCTEFNKFVGNSDSLSLSNLPLNESMAFALSNRTSPKMSTHEYCNVAKLNFTGIINK